MADALQRTLYALLPALYLISAILALVWAHSYCGVLVVSLVMVAVLLMLPNDQ